MPNAPKPDLNVAMAQLESRLTKAAKQINLLEHANAEGTYAGE